MIGTCQAGARELPVLHPQIALDWTSSCLADSVVVRPFSSVIRFARPGTTWRDDLFHHPRCSGPLSGEWRCQTSRTQSFVWMERPCAPILGLPSLSALRLTMTPSYALNASTVEG